MRFGKIWQQIRSRFRSRPSPPRGSQSNSKKRIRQAPSVRRRAKQNAAAAPKRGLGRVFSWLQKKLRRSLPRPQAKLTSFQEAPALEALPKESPLPIFSAPNSAPPAAIVHEFVHTPVAAADTANEIAPPQSFAMPPKTREQGGEDWLRGEIMAELERFVRTQRSQHTQRAYAADLRQFLGWLRSERYSPGIDALLEYRDWLVKPESELGLGLARASANRKFATVRSFLGWLQGRGFIRENPAIWVKNFRAKTESPTLGFSDSQVARMLELPGLYTLSGLMHATILHLLFYLGLRRSEVCALKCSHLAQARFGEGVITTLRVPGKGDKERILPLPPVVVKIINRYLDRRGLHYGEDKFLFRAIRGRGQMAKKESPLNTNTIAYIVKKYARRAGIDARVSPHSCRATAISNALDQGASHRAVQQMAGWSSPLMIERYDKRQTDLKNSAVHVVKYPEAN